MLREGLLSLVLSYYTFFVRRTGLHIRGSSCRMKVHAFPAPGKRREHKFAKYRCFYVILSTEHIECPTQPLALLLDYH